ncbi:MAG: peptidase dimerization domain-containing protein, partial [Elusimicrobiales bacterium]|nr:peptidase dimerization domain-containing protein [Elusimicrobiales bacterium]
DIAGCIEMENFNAHAVIIKITGKSVHPGTAKNSLANAIRIAGDIISSWPENLLPENAEGREGFIMFTDLSAEIEKAEIQGIVREHDREKLLAMEKQLEAIVAAKRYKYPAAQIEISFREQYRNMVEIINQNPQVMEKLKKAVVMAGLELRIKPVRGGTDGARLSFMGLPCPNVFTGGFNYHGRYEWVSLDGMNKSAQVLLNLASLWAE